MNKVILSTALLSILASNAFAAPTPTSGDVSSADIKWIGHSKIIPGDDITITGEFGAVEPNDGKISVQMDGRFETTIPVNLESHLYWDIDSDGAKDVGDLFATNWTLDTVRPVTVTWGANVVAGMVPTITDLYTGTDLTTTSGPSGVDKVSLKVSNVTPATVTPVDPREELQIQATVLATVA